MCSRTLMGCSDPPPLTGVGAPHQHPLGKLAVLCYYLLFILTTVFANSIFILVLCRRFYERQSQASVAADAAVRAHLQ